MNRNDSEINVWVSFCNSNFFLYTFWDFLLQYSGLDLNLWLFNGLKQKIKIQFLISKLKRRKWFSIQICVLHYNFLPFGKSVKILSFHEYLYEKRQLGKWSIKEFRSNKKHLKALILCVKKKLKEKFLLKNFNKWAVNLSFQKQDKHVLPLVLLSIERNSITLKVQ